MLGFPENLLFTLHSLLSQKSIPFPLITSPKNSKTPFTELNSQITKGITNTIAKCNQGMTRQKTTKGEYSLLFKNHGQRLEEDLRHRKPEDPYYATVAGSIRRIEVGLA